MMDIDWLRKLCLTFPRASEQIQWGYDLVFNVGGKMFAVAPLEPARVCLSFKCSEESFAELTERPGIIPAPYMARAKWVALETHEALPRAELASLLQASYSLVFAKLPKRMQADLAAVSPAKNKPANNPKNKTAAKKQKSARRKAKN
ncbi:MAG TPA: MmcQ/YjbR family DNA-binding protein [Candidatus Acidoferrum sp.]|jgi:predicted DNA-binding protein (MmcQ/YjbR family)